MGFYGNITSTTKTSFSFDRTYPNRHIMDLNAKKDGVYLGRYVLVEYDLDVQPYLEHQVEFGDDYLRVYCSNYFEGIDINQILLYSSPNFEQGTRLKYTTESAENNPHHGKDNHILEGQIVWILVDKDPTIQNKDEYRVFFQCTGSTGEPSNYALFTRVVNQDVKDHYVENFNIDINQYGKSRGYDSTVWQKVYTNDKEKYVMIAELNSVVPTFDLDVDAPTMSPLTPHFDTDSTSVYYKLHWQPQWGLRVSKQEDIPSDSDTIWIKETYDPETDIKTKWYWGKDEQEEEWKWIAYENENEIGKIAAAIHFNKSAFDPQVKSDRKTVEGINKHYFGTDDDINYFTIMPTGISGDTYNAHDGTGKRLPAEDIQEMRINLPAIGNMMSDAWDIIHGVYRNDDMREFDSENGNLRVDSLQGRLNSIAALNTDEIPIKRSSDGEVVGTRINGNEHFSYAEKETEKQEILSETISNSFDMDDPWISTTINTDRIKDNHTDTNEKGEYVGNNGISIHHTFHSTKDSTSSIDINQTENNITKSTTYKEDKIQNSNLGNKGDTITLYSPYVDATGHIVGKNIETITLPYAYKTFKTDNGVIAEEENDLYDIFNATPSSTTADNTQDILSIEPVNKWIQVKFENDKLNLAHNIQPLNNLFKSDIDLNSTGNIKSDSFTIDVYEFDKAGHLSAEGTQKIILPYGYQSFSSNNISKEHEKDLQDLYSGLETGITKSEASNTHDTLLITPVNKWIQTRLSDDKLELAHSIDPIDITDAEETNLNNGDIDNIVIQDIQHDAAGHIVANKNHSYILPYGFKYLHTSNSQNSSPLSSNNMENLEAIKVYDTLNISGGNTWIKTYIDGLATEDASGNITIEDPQLVISHGSPSQIGGNHYGLPYQVSSDTGGTGVKKTWVNFGESFTFYELQVDMAGHISRVEHEPIKLPLPSLNNLTATGASVLTGISMVPDTCAITQTNTNVGNLLLTDYSIGESVEQIIATDSINGAFGKLQKQLNNENTRALAAEAQVLSDAKTYTDEAKKAILTGESTTELKAAYDTLVEIQEWIEGDGVNAIELTSAIAAETERATNKEQSIEQIVNKEITDRKAITDTLRTAAYTDSTSYATAEQGRKADSALQLDTNILINENQEKTIEELLLMIVDLEQRIKTLEGTN